jgi:serine/threonine protein kinase/tetratricopeptide (TPR) repeat protein
MLKPPEEALTATDSRWISRQVAALAEAWQRGERASAEELLARHPGLAAEDAIRLIYEEVCLRRDAGQEVKTAEVVGRFPHWQDELEVLLGCDRILRPHAPGAVFPEAGATLGPFHLLAELGRGGSGRTYLATQPALADRPLVLKLVPEDQEEHLRLARLQHTHIVPLYGEQSFREHGLRALCMPYVGGASLAQVLSELRAIPLESRRGRHLLEALDHVQARIPGADPARPSAPGPCRRYLEEASYVAAFCWIGTCLSDALHHAHTRGLCHLDVTPANVLIASDGQPMLLDFHLAREPIPAGELVLDRLGGTPGWMSPEQEAALDAVREGWPVPDAVDGRADVHALGLLLRQALWGLGPEEAAGAASRRRGRPPGVSVGLADLIHKCLEPGPSARYADASALADDLRRHLNDLPLCGVANRSPIERWRKWQRRRPGRSPLRQAARLSIAAGVVVAVTWTAAVARQRVQEVEACLADGQRSCLEGNYLEALRLSQRGLASAGAVPGIGHLTRALRGQLDVAERALKVDELHRLADLIRFRYGLEGPPEDEARMLLRHCPTIWDQRRRLVGSDRGRDRDVKADLLELAIVWTDLRVRLAPRQDAAAERRAALRCLDEAAAMFGPSPSLDRTRRAHARALGLALDPPAAAPAPSSAWEHYELGRSHLRSGEIAAAALEFRRALQHRPQDFWPNFYQGLCAYRLGEYEDACAAFRTCIALAPTAAECYYNRGLAEEALGRLDDAHADHGRALELDGDLAAPALNRGVLGYKAGRYGEAIADLHRALRGATDPAVVSRIHYNLALAYLAAGDRASARISGEKALGLGCEEARGLCDRLRRGS